MMGVNSNHHGVAPSTKDQFEETTQKNKRAASEMDGLSASSTPSPPSLASKKIKMFPVTAAAGEPSGSTSSSSSNKNTPIAVPVASASSSNRLERKRHQEKRRRVEFKEALDHLLSTLLSHDTDFSREARHRETRNGGRTEEGEAALFNRVELINQSIFTLNRVVQENVDMKKAFADYQRTGQKSELVAPPDRHASVRYHQGVGPLATTTSTVTTRREPVQYHHQAAAALQNQLPSSFEAHMREQAILGAHGGASPGAHSSRAPGSAADQQHAQLVAAVLRREHAGSLQQQQQQQHDAAMVMRHQQQRAETSHQLQAIAQQQASLQQFMALNNAQGGVSGSPFASGGVQAALLAAMMGGRISNPALLGHMTGGPLAAQQSPSHRAILAELLAKQGGIGGGSVSLERTLSESFPSSVPSSSTAGRDGSSGR